LSRQTSADARDSTEEYFVLTFFLQAGGGPVFRVRFILGNYTAKTQSGKAEPLLDGFFTWILEILGSEEREMRASADFIDARPWLYGVGE
jgi:hypothetical protein